MTTIVCKDGVMCSDSQASRGDFIDNQEVTKIFQVHGCLIGISGSLIGAMKFIDWFSETLEVTQAQEDYPHLMVTPPEELVNKDFHCLVMYPDKTVYEFFGSDDVLKVDTEYTAVGSGMFYALSALDAGVTPEKAVEIAIKRDVFSGGAVQTFKVELPKQLTEEEVRELDKDQLVNLVLTGDTEGEIPLENAPLYDGTVESVLESELIVFEVKHGSGGFPLIIRKDGTMADDEGDFSSFEEIVCSLDFGYIEAVAKALEIKFAHNISLNKLVKRCDEKVKELVAELNK